MLSLAAAGAPISARKLTAEKASLASLGGVITVQHLIAKAARIETTLQEQHIEQMSKHGSPSHHAMGAIDLTTAYANTLDLAAGRGPGTPAIPAHASCI